MVGIVPLPLRLVSPDFCDSVPAPAHDSLSAADRRAYLQTCPDSYFAVTRSLEDLPSDVEMTVVELLESGRDSLNKLLSKDAFTAERADAMYVYRLDDGEHTQTGVLCGAETAAFTSGEIRAHEEVFGAQREHLALHFEIVGAQSSPIVMAHADDAVIDRAVATAMTDEPLLDFTMPDGLRQTIWAIGADEGRSIAAALADEAFYIIDGHHRTGAAEAYQVGREHSTADHMLTAVFPASEMRSLAFHRWLRAADDCGWLFGGLRDHHEIRLIEVDELDDRDDDELAIYHDGEWIAVRLPELPGGDALSELDPVRLQRHLLGPLVGIDESAPRTRLDYVSGDRDVSMLMKLVDEEGGALALMRPVRMDQLFAVADAGQIMPPKSTYFMPKARSGVVLRHL